MSDVIEFGKPFAAAVAVGLTGIGAGFAEAMIGTAAVGAIAENEKLFGQALLMTIIPESIVIFGLIIGIVALFV